MTHSRDSISTQDSKNWLEVLFSRLSLILKLSSRIGYELYLTDLPVYSRENLLREPFTVTTQQRSRSNEKGLTRARLYDYYYYYS